jgi:hypothetical protein
MNKKYFDKYLKQWYFSNYVPNNEEFVKKFIEFIKSTTYDQWQFKGINGYCGYTALVANCPFHLRHFAETGMLFEIAYGEDFVKVFNGNNNGFWVPEYIDLKGKDSVKILNILKSKFLEWGGFIHSSKVIV